MYQITQLLSSRDKVPLLGLLIWLMARLFRVQTLLSGESLSIRRMWSALKS
jgi:hypothetical protein